MHVLSDRGGLPLVVGISAGNTHDQHGLIPLVQALQMKHDPDRGLHYRPRKVHADEAYDSPELREWLRWQQILPRIARKGIESSQTLGRHRWVIERTMAWLTGYRRIARRRTLFTQWRPGWRWVRRQRGVEQGAQFVEVGMGGAKPGIGVGGADTADACTRS
ncbi:DDE family transposase [Streptomyces sp. TLI_235]|nr:DDE family transposase [Streptomyces sp. TLI_235]